MLKSFNCILLTGCASIALASAGAASAQTAPTDTAPAATPTGAETPANDKDDSGEVIVTGSRIRQDPNKSALPLQIITRQELTREGISSPEQFISYLSSNGNGADNLASNSDVVQGAQRGTNGLSAANLRGQGAAATLVLLNNRRVAAHGLSGAAVDVNQIPFAAIERIEVLKDGASAIYGTDAIGGVINYITRTNYKGIGVQGFVDTPEASGGQIYRVSGIVGFGDLQEDGFNVMGAVAKRWNKALFGYQRDWNNGNQPNRGLSIDTRGTPIATAFALNNGTFLPRGPLGQTGTLLGGTSGAVGNGGASTGPLSGLLIPGSTTTTYAAGGINVLDLPGGAGCGSMPSGLPYDEALWQTPQAAYACSWDTSDAVVIQQPIETLTYYARAVSRLGAGHEFSVEVTGSDASSAKRFSNAQVSTNTSNFQAAYPLNARTQATYNGIYNAIYNAFPTAQAGLAANYGKPIAFRWRCLDCGPREYNTDAKTFRIAAGIDGPITNKWDYRVGSSYARSEASSTLGSGYYYRGTLASGAYDPAAPSASGAAGPGLAGAINAGLINPFAISQDAVGQAALAAVSAEGATLYGGRYEVRQLDASVSGSLFALPGGDVKIAAGVDYRKETYSFNGSDAAAATAPVIFLAAFDNVNALTPKQRTVKAAFAEVLFPIFDSLEISAAGRIDDYTGFGTTTNPKVSARFRPLPWLMFRGSYSTGFRVPTFNQIFNGRTESVTNTGANIADPLTCARPTAPDTSPGCALITPDIFTGGNLNLGPETSKGINAGVVFQPNTNFSLSVDWWKINVDNVIANLTFRQLLENYTLFESRFIRTGGVLTDIDATTINAGARRTQGLEIAARGALEGLGGRFSAGLDGTYLLKKKEKLTQDAPYGPSLIGLFTYAGDLGIRWKHNAFITYANEDFTLSFSQIFREGYKNGALPGIASGTITRPDYNPRVKDYVLYNASLTFRVIPNYDLTLGVRNIFDRDPPFAITYDGVSGAGGSWEPRVADPRGRSFTVSVDTRF